MIGQDLKPPIRKGDLIVDSTAADFVVFSAVADAYHPEEWQDGGWGYLHRGELKRAECFYKASPANLELSEVLESIRCALAKHIKREDIGPLSARPNCPYCGALTGNTPQPCGACKRERRSRRLGLDIEELRYFVTLCKKLYPGEAVRDLVSKQLVVFVSADHSAESRERGDLADYWDRIQAEQGSTRRALRITKQAACAVVAS